MAQFIRVTDAHGIQHRLNVSFVASYAPNAKDGGCEARIMMSNEFVLEVQETAEALDHAVQNIHKRSFFSAEPE